MPEFVADFSEAKQFIKLPRGVYNVHIASCEMGKSRRSGIDMLKIRLEIDEVVSLADGAEFTAEQCLGQALFSNLMLGGEGAGITQQAFEAMFGEVEQAPGDTESFIGVGCAVKVTHRVWKAEDGGDDEERANVSKFLPLASAAGLFS
jgi:hypothetical protein